jgi:hypothetical protein
MIVGIIVIMMMMIIIIIISGGGGCAGLIIMTVGALMRTAGRPLIWPASSRLAAAAESAPINQLTGRRLRGRRDRRGGRRQNKQHGRPSLAAPSGARSRHQAMGRLRAGLVTGA